ncbi:MAG: hypothetical protein RBT49_00290 [Bacteroidales bacterium]|jgi:hypothetical protein|nr:hypothetical protein [Bacteroidales bacterium]
MINVTYFTGAGASYHSIPLIKTMNKRMKAFSQFLKDQKESGKLTHDFAEKFINELDELIEIEKNRTSIDAYARELELSGSVKKLLHLKTILTSYLIFEQLNKPKDLVLNSGDYNYKGIPKSPIPLDTEYQEMIKVPIDKRYITFWGEHLKPNNDKLSNNIKVLSWNYDMQFEFSYSQIKKFSLELTQQNLQVFPSVLKDIDIKQSCILKLNGTAGLLYDNHTKTKLFNLFDYREHSLMENLDYLIEPFKVNFDRAYIEPLLTFAWESKTLVFNTRKYAKEIIQDTDILVIIGYSFPRFNQDVDREIFKEVPKLKKIYYQAKEDELPELIEKLDGINSKMASITKGVKNLDTFYYPSEL